VTYKQSPQRELSRARTVILYALCVTVENAWTRNSLALNETMMRSTWSLSAGSAASTLIGSLPNMATLAITFYVIVPAVVGAILLLIDSKS
jgi:hypothetical protein